MGIPLSLGAFERRDIPVRSTQSEKTVKLFPNSIRGAPGDLLLELPAIPLSLGEPRHQDPYWWVDGKFFPFDNTRMIVSAGAYMLRPGRTWVPCPGVKPGVITAWQLGDKDKLPAWGVFKGTQTSARPQIQLHPDGKYFGFVDRGFVRVLDVANNDRYKIDDDTRAVSHKHCAFSPDGISIAVLFRSLCQFELEISSLDMRARKVNRIICHKLSSHFKGSRQYTEQVECKFSPDSRLVALSHSNGTLFTVTNSDLNLHCEIFPGMVQDVVLSNERSFDFHPLFEHSVIAAGGNDGLLYICDIESQEILHKELLHDGTECFDCLKFSPNGEQLAIALSNFTISLFSTKTRQVLGSLDNLVKCPHVIEHPQTGRLPEVTKMCFDHSGQRLAVSSCDGKIRIWQMTTDMDLRYLCKLNIQQHYSTKSIRNFPLPASMIGFLLH